MLACSPSRLSDSSRMLMTLVGSPRVFPSTKCWVAFDVHRLGFCKNFWPQHFRLRFSYVVLLLSVLSLKHAFVIHQHFTKETLVNKGAASSIMLLRRHRRFHSHIGDIESANVEPLALQELHSRAINSNRRFGRGPQHDAAGIRYLLEECVIKRISARRNQRKHSPLSSSSSLQMNRPSCPTRAVGLCIS